MAKAVYPTQESSEKLPSKNIIVGELDDLRQMISQQIFQNLTKVIVTLSHVAIFLVNFHGFHQ
jgi:hypothetical protein